jgi:outer membrane protein TolC
MSSDDNELPKMRQQRDRLRAALVGLVGAEHPDELRAMEATLRFVPAPDSDKVAMINAIHILLETATAEVVPE